MRCYFAPLEGLTDSIFRRLHHEYFPGVDRYYTPFFSPTQHRALTAREKRELPLSADMSVTVIPQVLTKNPEDFLWFAQVCADRGYEEVNLNLGCPSGTVTAKGKGAGMLRQPQELDRFLDAVFQSTPLPVSLKTRLGFERPEELEALLPIYNRYPVKELTIHPRVRKDFYNGDVQMPWFDYGMAHSKAPVCYNGNLYTKEQIEDLKVRYPKLEAVMLGRGLIADPGMFTPGGTTVVALEAFYDALLEHYLEAFGGARNAMFRMKENWQYLLCRFQNSQQLGKRLRKTTSLEEYRSITREIFHTLPLTEQLECGW